MEEDERDGINFSYPSSIGNLNQVFICSEEGCNSRFSKRSYLEQHMCIHTSERPFVCPNENCNKSYKRKDHLNRHTKQCPSSHPGEIALFPCAVEGSEQKLLNSDCLSKQIRTLHLTKKRTFPCPIDGCSQIFKKHQELKAHEFDHTQKNPFECPHPGCEMSFRWMNRLKRHMKIHKGYSCPECEEKFEKWTLLLKHKTSAHQVQQICAVCKKTFSHRHRLKVHMKIHSEEREVFECPREGCVRYYSEKRNLDAHIRSYHDGRRFPCMHETCKQTFAFKHKMLEHLKSHSITGKFKKKFPKKSHRKKNVVSLLTGIKNEAGVKGSLDSDALLPSSSNTTESFSTLPSCDWGGVSDIWGRNNFSKPEEDNVSALKPMETPRKDPSDSDIYLLTEDHVQTTTNDIENSKDKWIPSGNSIPTSKSQIHSTHTLGTINPAGVCSLTNTETNSEWETIKSTQVNNHFKPLLSSDNHLQSYKNSQLTTVTCEGICDEVPLETNHDPKLADDDTENDPSVKDEHVLNTGQTPTDNLFQCSLCSESFMCNSLLREHQKQHPKEPQSFPCPRKNCHNIYTMQQKLNLHLQCDHDGLGFLCMYANCGMVFDSKRALERHFNLHNVKMRQKKKDRLANIISENSF